MFKLVTAPTAAEILTFVPMTDILFALGKDTDASETDTSDNTRLTSLLPTAYYNVETMLNRALLTQTWDLFTDTWESTFELTEPLASVTHVKYYDRDNALQEATVTTDYLTFADANEVKMLNTFSLYARGDAINVRFICGEAYGSIHPTIKEGILEEIWGLFYKEDRSARVTEIIHAQRVFEL